MFSIFGAYFLLPLAGRWSTKAGLQHLQPGARPAAAAPVGPSLEPQGLETADSGAARMALAERAAGRQMVVLVQQPCAAARAALQLFGLICVALQ